MDYKEKVIALLNNKELSKEQKEKLESIFPELAESENEMIRKGIIMCVKGMPDNDFRKKCISWLEKQAEQKPTDKVEPKFHEGEWITNGATNPAQISSIKDGMYFTHNDTIGGDVESIDKEYHLWSINDAKDGDVLYSLDSKQPFIFKHRKTNEQAKVYCGINIYGKFFVGNTKDCVITTDKYIPATKEQRDKLEKAMTDAGYRWNSDEKKMEKIEQKSADVEEPDFFDDFRKSDVEVDSNEDGLIAETIRYKKEQKPAEWSEEDERMYRGLHNLIYSTQYCDSRKEFSDFLDSLKNRVQLQSQQEWDKEDEKCIRLSTDIIDSALRAGFCVQLDRDRCVDWLKSLRPQPKYEWTEKDEINRDLIYNALNHVYDLEHNKSLCDWLNSLRPYSQWKPSDEQITALNYVVNLMASSESPKENDYYYNVFKDLREQLKKLREE